MWLCSSNPFLARSLRELGGAGDWGQDNIEIDGGCCATWNTIVGDEWVGRWVQGGRRTLHRGCFLVSLTTVFLLDLNCPFGFLLTWFSGKSIVNLCVTPCPATPVPFTVHFTTSSHLKTGQPFSQRKARHTESPIASLSPWHNIVYEESLNRNLLVFLGLV